MRRPRSPLAFVASAGQRPSQSLPGSDATLFAPHHRLESTTQLQATLPSAVPAVINRIRSSFLPTTASSAPFTAAVFLSALCLGYFLGRRRRRIVPSQTVTISNTDFGEEGVTPLWLNYGITKLWKLFQKNTKQFTQESLQPILDDVDKPDFVKAVRLVSYNIGKNSPRITNLHPVPARSLAEIQCRYDLQLSSTSDMTFEVDVVLPDKLSFSQTNKTVTIPVDLSNLHLNAHMWSAFTMAPYEPYCTTWRFSLLETPSVQFDMNVASALPITAVPGLRSWFFRLIRTEIPKDFKFPKSNTVDFTPKSMRKKKKEFMNLTISEIEQMSDDEVKEYFPKEWALYRSLDLDKSGSLSRKDLTEGLDDWGYSTEDAAEFYEKLDKNDEGAVTFPQFCLMWPNVTSSEISQDYEGILSLTVHQASNLTSHDFGWRDPFVGITLGNETVTADTLNTNGDDNDGANITVLDNSFELKCTSIENETLQIRVAEDSTLFGRRTVAEADVPLIDLVDRPTQTINVDLEPQGQLKLDLSYGKFVDRWDICLQDDDDDDDECHHSNFQPKKTIKVAESTVIHHGKNGKTTLHSDNNSHKGKASLTPTKSVVQGAVEKVAARVYEKAKSLIEK